MSWPVVIAGRNPSGVPGAWRCTGRNNEEMVDRLVQMGVITSKEVEEAFRAVPRGAFVPPDQQVEAYLDSPLLGDFHLHMSAPHMYATVLEALDLSPGLSFLNIGSGTGYFSCLAGCILQAQGINHGIELHEDLVAFAKERVEEYLRFSPTVAYDICPPKFVAGNCFRLDPAGCNYDRVYCGAACPASKVHFILGLTKIGGFAVIPCRGKLLKIERISDTGVKQTSISEVSFASLVAMPESDSSLPKLYFPKESSRKKEKALQVYPPSDMLVSRGQARTLLARLRALQEASECLHMSLPLPVAFCYVPSEQQIQHYLNKKSKAKKESSTVVTSPVDRRISFFGSQDTCGETRNSHSDQTGSESLWSHLQQDKLWQTVLEYYYSLCNVSIEKRCQALNVHIKRRVKQKNERRGSKKSLSYAEIAHKLGILSVNTSHAEISKQESQDRVEKRTESDGVPCTCTVAASSTNGCSTQDFNATEKLTTNGSSTDLPCHTMNDLTDKSQSNSHQTISCDAIKVPSTSSNNEPLENCSRKSSLDKDFTCQLSSPSECRTSSTSSVSNGPQYSYVPIDMEKVHMERLSSAPSNSWNLNNDLVLVHFLCDIHEKSNPGRCKGWFKAESVIPELFTKTGASSHPRLSCFSPEKLAYRAIALCRIAQILDSVLYLMSGPSVLSDKTFCPNRFQLDSFTESSFMSSWLYLETGGSQTPVSKRKEDLSKLDLEGRTDDEPKEENNHLQEVNAKKITASRASLERYREQLKSVKNKIHFIEEQKQLVHSIREQELVPQELTFDMDVVDVKLQRNELLLRQQKQDHYRNNLQALLKKLKEEEKQLNKKLESSIEASKQEAIDLPQPSSSAQLDNNTPQKQADPSEKWSVRPTSSQENDSNNSVRYDLSSLLPKMRFLLPLCNQRWRLVQELLHTTELSAPDYMPVITVDRRVPLIERHADSRNSVFVQVYHELKGEKLHFRWNKRKYDQWWEVKFVGEGIIDQGGGFRDSLAEIADELCPPEERIPDILPYLIRTPNHKEKTGDFLDCFIPNPSCDALHMFHWLGVLMGGVYRSDESLTLAFPPFVWKLIVGEHVTWAKDYVAIDEAALHITDELEVQDEASYLSNYGNECTFSTVLSDGRRVELLPGGEGRVVKPKERQEYACLVRRARMTEFTKQVQAIREGLMSVIPESVLSLLTWSNLERGVCGDREISLAQLKSSCKYGDDLNESSESVKHLRTVLTQFTSDERSRFLRFVTGRKRPPAPFTVAKAGGDKDSLPHASTCASTLFLPDYSSSVIAKEKLSYAISNCVAIDTDTSPW
ncbi:hypothetical protein ACROYT_G009151 [Oculina patagonica]